MKSFTDEEIAKIQEAAKLIRGNRLWTEDLVIEFNKRFHNLRAGYDREMKSLARVGCEIVNVGKYGTVNSGAVFVTTIGNYLEAQSVIAVQELERNRVFNAKVSEIDESFA